MMYLALIKAVKWMVNKFFFFQAGSHYVSRQAGLELLGPSNPLASASPVVGTTGGITMPDLMMNKCLKVDSAGFPYRGSYNCPAWF
jgi:hypothetical protein